MHRRDDVDEVMTPEEFARRMHEISEREEGDSLKELEEVVEVMCNILWKLGYDRGIEIICA